jgi:hypothetical protein
MEQEHLLAIPTFVDEQQEDAKRYDWSCPHDVTIRSDGSGLRVFLGHPKAPDTPDVLIERTPDRWRIFLHPDESHLACILEVTSDAVTVQTETGEKVLTYPGDTG